MLWTTRVRQVKLMEVRRSIVSNLILNFVAVWRIVVGLSLIPAFGTLYQRLTLSESTRYIESRKIGEDTDSLEKKSSPTKEANDNDVSDDVKPQDHVDGEFLKSKAHFSEFIRYFSEFAHLKILIGTCACWFFLDIAFYGINLNQNVVLQEIGFDGSTGTAWERLFKIGIGNLIITALGFVPGTPSWQHFQSTYIFAKGYYVTVLTIEKLGRKWIQIQGFLLAALFLAILAGKFNSMSHAAFIVNFALLQVGWFLVSESELIPRSSSSTLGQIQQHMCVFVIILLPSLHLSRSTLLKSSLLVSELSHTVYRQRVVKQGLLFPH